MKRDPRKTDVKKDGYNGVGPPKNPNDFEFKMVEALEKLTTILNLLYRIISTIHLIGGDWFL